MWNVDFEELEQLTPTDQLWVIAQAMEENSGPAAYVTALRAVADRLEEVGWWLAELVAGRTGALLRTSGR